MCLGVSLQKTQHCFALLELLSSKIASQQQLIALVQSM